MKLSKVLSLVIAFAMLLTASTIGTAFAFSDVDTESDAYEAITALSALDILNGYEDGTFLPDGKITRAEFATIVMRTLGMNVNSKVDTIFSDVKSDHWASGAINEAFGAGIVNGRTLEYAADNETIIGGTFDPEAEVTYDEAVKMIVCSMGYDLKAKSMVKTGVNPFPTAYNLVANQKGITSGVEKTAGGASRATVAKLVWNALPVELMDQTSYGSEAKFEEIPSQSLLYTKLKAVVMDAKIDELSLDPEEKNVDFTDIELDDVANHEKNYDGNTSDFASIDKGACDLAGLQGLKVKVLVDISDSKNPVVIAVFPSSTNKTLEVDPQLFVKVDSSKRIEYYKSSDASTTNTSSKIENPLSIYVNLVKSNKTVDEVTDLTENPGNSLYRFVDTDNNGYYDTLFVDNYASFVVGRVSAEDYEISNDTSASVYNSSTDFDAMGYDYDYDLTLDPEDDNIAWSLKDTEGKELQVSDVNVGDVITYAMSTDGTNYYYDITVCKSTAVTGTVSEIKKRTKKSGDGQTKVYYVIDGTEYRLNSADDAEDPTIDAGSTGTFAITADGKIISCTLDATARSFAAAIKVAKDDSAFSTTLKLQLMDSKGAIQTLEFADKFYDNNDDTTTEAKSANVTTLNDAIAGAPVMYELNSSGKIRKIFYDNGIKTKDEDYRVITGTDAVYSESSDKLGSAYFTDDSAVITTKVAFGDSDITDKTNYSFASSSSLIDEKEYTYKAVVDSDKNVVLMIIDNFTVLPSYGDAPMYVTGISTVSVDGSSRTKIEGYVGKDLVGYALADSEDLTVVYMDGQEAKTGATTDAAIKALGTKIKVGDAIQFVLNGSDEITAYRHLVKTVAATDTEPAKAYFLVADDMAADMDAKDDAIDANLVSYSLDAQSSLPVDFKTAGTVVKSGLTMSGYGAFGRVQRVSSKTVGLFYDISAGEAFENYIDVTGDTNLPLYLVSDEYADGYELKSLSSVKTYKSTGKIEKTDDVIYIFRYDDDAVFQYAIDTLGNN